MPNLSKAHIKKAFINGDRAKSSQVRGRLLEDLLAYIFAQIPGVRLVRRNVRAANGSEEIDLVFWNAQLKNGLPYLPNILLFECKNWKSAVDSASVSHFLSKLRNRHLEYGFLIAANGITGDVVDIKAAHQAIETALVRDNIKLIVLDRIELCALASTAELIRLTQDKTADIILRAV